MSKLHIFVVDGNLCQQKNLESGVFEFTKLKGLEGVEVGVQSTNFNVQPRIC